MNKSIKTVSKNDIVTKVFSSFFAQIILFLVRSTDISSCSNQQPHSLFRALVCSPVEGSPLFLVQGIYICPPLHKKSHLNDQDVGKAKTATANKI